MKRFMEEVFYISLALCLILIAASIFSAEPASAQQEVTPPPSFYTSEGGFYDKVLYNGTPHIVTGFKIVNNGVVTFSDGVFYPDANIGYTQWLEVSGDCLMKYKPDQVFMKVMNERGGGQLVYDDNGQAFSFHAIFQAEPFHLEASQLAPYTNWMRCSFSVRELR